MKYLSFRLVLFIPTHKRHPRSHGLAYLLDGMLSGGAFEGAEHRASCLIFQNPLAGELPCLDVE